MTAPDPTAGERCSWCNGTGYNGPDDCTQCDGTGASPPAVAASTGTSEDVEALAVRLYLADHRPGGGRDSWEMLADHRRKPYRAMAHAARDYARAREAAARSEERERIAQAIEARKATFVLGGALDACACRVLDLAARIAREVRP